MLRSFVYVIAMLICAEVHAQLMPFRNYGIKDGLENNNVQSVIKDNRGLLWIGTDLGVYWFDGKRFYQPKIKTNIGQLYINRFYKDDDGTIWILTYFNGVYKYQDERFTNFLTDSLLRNVSTNSVSEMVSIAPGKHVLISDGFPYLFDGKKFFVLDSSNHALRSTNSVTRLSDSILLISTETGIYVYRYENGRYLLAGHALENRRTSRMLICGDRIWVGTGNGLEVFEADGAQTFSRAGTTYLPGKEIKDVVTGNNGDLWVLTDTVYKINNGKVTTYTAANGMPDDIQHIYRDDAGLMWFAHKKGFSVLADEYYEFIPLNNGKQTLAVGLINEDRENNLWLGTGDGLVAKDDNDLTFFKKSGGNEIGFVNCFYKSKNGTLFATANAGVFRLDNHRVSKEANLLTTAITADNKERLWLGDENGSIHLYDNGKVTKLSISDFNREMITALSVQNENVWVGYRSSGARKYRLEGDSLALVRSYTGEGYNDFRIRSCATDTKGNIVFGTRTNGLFIFSTQTDSLVAHITVQNGLIANWIKGILADTDGKLYLATNCGINILSGNYKAPEFRELKINNEKINRETNCITRAGKDYYIGTNEGLLKWMPGRMNKDTAAPPVYFISIDIQGRNDFSIGPYTENAGDISLPYEQHVISFEFAGISLKKPEGVTYKYVLEGQSKEWSPLTDRNYVAYNLKPGNYTFKVVAQNADSVISRHPAVFRFTIRPPFWSTWWFIAASAIIVLLIGYGAYRYRVSKLLELELLRNKISTDLHDDIGSTLSSISILSNMALKESSRDAMLEMIKGISENSGSLLEKMDDIVWSINPNHDTLENLLVRFRRFASVLLEAKNIEYSIEIEPSVRNVKLSMDYRQHIYMILKETINNLVKYSECTRAVITVLFQNGYLDITVRDNGKGFDQATVQYGNGILNMQERAKRMNAAITIFSRPGEGTTINIRLKIK